MSEKKRPVPFPREVFPLESVPVFFWECVFLIAWLVFVFEAGG